MKHLNKASVWVPVTVALTVVLGFLSFAWLMFMSSHRALVPERARIPPLRVAKALSRRLFGKHPDSDRHEAAKQAVIDRRYLRMAEIWAENSYCQRRKVGAIIVKNSTW